MIKKYRLENSLRRALSFYQLYRGVAAMAWRIAGAKRFATAFVLDFGSVLARGASVVVVISALSLLEKEAEFFPMTTIPVPSGYSLLLLMGLVVFALFLVAALTSYQAAIVIRRIGRLLHTSAACKALNDIATLGHSPFLAALPPGALRKHVTRDSMQLGVATTLILKLVQPALFTVIALIIIFTLEPEVSLILSVMSLPLLPILYWVASSIQANARQFYSKKVREMGAAVGAMLRRESSYHVPGLARTRPGEKLLASTPYRDYLDGLDGLRLATIKLSLVIAVFRSGFVAFGICAVGWLAFQGHRPWSAIIGFAMGLVYLTNALQSLVASVGTLTRFHPQIQALFRLYQAAIDNNDPQEAMTGEKAITLISEKSIPGSVAKASISTGEVLWLTSPHDPARSELASFLHPLMKSARTAAGRWRHTGFLGPRPNFDEEDLNHLIEIWQDAVQACPDIADFVKKHDKRFALHDPDSGAFHDLTPKHWPDLPRRSKYLVALIAAFHHDTEILFVAESTISRLGDSFIERLMAQFRDRTLIIVANPDNPKPRVAQTFAVASDSAVIGLGDYDWFVEQKDEIIEQLASAPVRQSDTDELDESLFE